MVQTARLRSASLHKWKTIIAMKGAPFTRKTEFASLIAASLRCPLLSAVDFLDVLGPDNVQISPNSPNTSSTPPSQLPQDLAFQIICQMTESHLSNGFSDKVVIDSPLSSRSHLDRLIKLASSMQKTRLIIVECKPENNYLWQMKFDQHLQKNPHLTPKWYKAQSWDEVIKEAIQCDDEISEGYKVSKLILDPLMDYLYKPGALLRIRLIFKPPPFMEAVEYMMKREEGDGPDVVVYRQWQFNSCAPPNAKANAAGESSQTKEMEILKQWYYCRDGHTVTKYIEELEFQYEDAKCMACGNQIKGQAYTCNNCTLALHKECAESFDKNSTLRIPNIKGFLRFIKNPMPKFPQVFDCSSCKIIGKAFSEECASCLFETNLKCHFRPTVIKHSCDKHFLSIELSRRSAYQEVHMCSACGSYVEFVFYTCKICCTYYHFHCLHDIPIQMKHEHGGHHHQLLLEFNDSEKAEDYICDECLELRDPDKWFYSCKDCPYYAHLECILSRIRERGSLHWQVPAGNG